MRTVLGEEEGGEGGERDRKGEKKVVRETKTGQWARSVLASPAQVARGVTVGQRAVTPLTPLRLLRVRRPHLRQAHRRNRLRLKTLTRPNTDFSLSLSGVFSLFGESLVFSLFGETFLFLKSFKSV